MVKVTEPEEKRVVSHYCKDLCSTAYLISLGYKALIEAELSLWHDVAYIIFCR